MNNLVDPAIDYIKNNSVEIAFCDYNMAKMNGIELAKIIKEYSPKADIVFVTGYGEYALDAINEVVPKGYILKPVSKSKIEAVINNLESFNSQKDIYIKTFGSFEVFYKNTPLNFKVKKAKELLAYLVDRAGATCTRKELTAVLYEDKEERNAQRYFADALSCLTETLASVNSEEIFLRNYNSYSIDKTLVSCDLFDYLDGNTHLFRGEYMSQYSWGEYTLADFLNI